MNTVERRTQGDRRKSQRKRDHPDIRALRAHVPTAATLPLVCEADAHLELSLWRGWFWAWEDQIPLRAQEAAPASWNKVNAVTDSEGQADG